MKENRVSFFAYEQAGIRGEPYLAWWTRCRNGVTKMSLMYGSGTLVGYQIFDALLAGVLKEEIENLMCDWIAKNGKLPRGVCGYIDDSAGQIMHVPIELGEQLRNQIHKRFESTLRVMLRATKGTDLSFITAQRTATPQTPSSPKKVAASIAKPKSPARQKPLARPKPPATPKPLASPKKPAQSAIVLPFSKTFH